MKEIKFKTGEQCINYPINLQKEIKKQNLICENYSPYNSYQNVNGNLVWDRTTQGHKFWDDLYYGKDMSKYTEWLHLFGDTISEEPYEIY